MGWGSKLHIKIFKAQRPDRFSVVAYRELDEYGFPPYGEGRRLDTTLRRVERDGKTVAWNVFFRVNEPYRHYYLDTFGTWKRVPGSEATYGDANWHFHVKTLRLSTGWGG
jgi:hypothetical protein